jgi:crotonobetainyl-CoA:carnitine CoA-transferase CaiB-like acyl-CoA transferase
MGLEPASGISSFTGYPGGDPLRSGISFTDPYTGIVGAGAVLAAILYRSRTGKGQYIDLSEQEAAIPVAGYALADFAMNGREPERIGNRSLWYAPQGCYRCKGDDDWLVLTVQNDAEWAALAGAVGHPEWETVLQRFANHDEIDRLIGEWTAAQDHREAMMTLQAAGVTAAAVLNPKEVLLDRHLKSRGFFDMVDTEVAGVRPVPHQVGATFSAFTPDSARRAPKLGEHNDEILKGLLGMSDEEVAGLAESGIIGDQPQLLFPMQVMRMFVQWPTTSFQGMGQVAAIDLDYKEQLGIGE